MICVEVYYLKAGGREGKNPTSPSCFAQNRDIPDFTQLEKRIATSTIANMLENASKEYADKALLEQARRNMRSTPTP